MSDIAVKFDRVSFSYGGVSRNNSAAVLENASFHIHKGEFVAMVGPNGSGKTTALKLLLGLITPCCGSIEIFDAPCGAAANGNLAYIPQYLPADNMFPITVHGIVRMGLLQPFKGYSKENGVVTQALEQAGIADISAKLYSSLSGGQKRRTLVARALAANPRLLVLDEPTANMDRESETRLYETLALCKGKTTILFVTHNTDFVSSLTDRVLCLGDGSRGVVQHRVEHSPSARHGISGLEVRVLHGENISQDACCPAEGG